MKKGDLKCEFTWDRGRLFDHLCAEVIHEVRSRSGDDARISSLFSGDACLIYDRKFLALYVTSVHLHTRPQFSSAFSSFHLGMPLSP